MDKTTKNRRNKIACWGFYGKRNLGDDLILYELIKHFAPYEDKVSLVISGETTETERLNQFKIETRSIGRNPVRFLLESLSCKLVVCGPGGLFPHDNTFKLLYWVLLSLITRVRGNQIIFIGIGIGRRNFASPINRFLIRTIISLSEAFITRQSNVKEAVHSHSCNLMEKDDVLFTLDEKEYLIKKSYKTVAVILANIFESAPDMMEPFASSLAHVLNGLILESEYQIKLFTFTDGIDDVLNKELVKQLNPSALKMVEIVPFQEDPRINLFKISQVEICIAMRFHALVISSLFRIPCCMIAYSDKIDDVAEKLGISDYVLRICVNPNEYYGEYISLDEEKFQNIVYDLITNREELREMLDMNVPKLKKQASASWIKLNEILNSL